MKKDNPLKTAIVASVTVAHIVGGIWLYFLSQKKDPEPLTADNLTFVDLGSLDGNGEAGTEGAPALPNNPPPPKPEPPPPPKPKQPPPKKVVEKVVETKPQVKAVERDDVKADLVKPKETVKPKPIEKPKPIKQPKPIEKPIEKPKEKPVEKPIEQPIEKPVNQSADTKPNLSNLNKNHSANSSANNSSKNASNSGNSNAANTSPNGKANGGGGNNPNSGNPSNGAGSKDGKDSGKGLKGNGDQDDKPKNPTGIADGGYIKKPAPPYPAAAREREEEGSVTIEVIVGANGNVESTRVAKSSGSPRLDRAAKDAAARASYKPKSQGGVPMKTRFMAAYTFSLDE